MCRLPHVAFTVLFLSAASISAAQTPPPKTSHPVATPLKTLIDRGRLQLGAQRPAKAAQSFREAIKRFPKSAIAHNELGVALFQQAAYKAATPYFKKATQLDPKLGHAFANLAETQRLAGDFKHAALSYHAFLQLQRGDRYGIYGLALCFEGYDQLQKSLKTLRIAERRAKAQKDPRLLARVGAAIGRVREKLSEASLSLLQRGDARLMAGRWTEALAFYNRGLKKAPQNATLLGRKGLVFAIQGDLTQGRKTLEAALLLDPSVAANRTAFALILDAQGDQTPTADSKGAAALLQADRAAAALKAFGEALSKNDTPALYEGRGESALRMGLLDDAAEDLGTAGGSQTSRAGLAEIALLKGAKPTDRAALPVPIEDLPVWRRSLLASAPEPVPEVE